jgi:hypothetical protein
MINFFYGPGGRRFANPIGYLSFFVIAFTMSVLVYRVPSLPGQPTSHPTF